MGWDSDLSKKGHGCVFATTVKTELKGICMKKTLKLLPNTLIVFVVFWLSACSMSLVSQHDSLSQEHMLEVSKKIEALYLALLSAPKEQRDYPLFQQSYLDIQVELSSLKLRQAMRANNALTLRQVETAITLWDQDMQQHKDKNTVSDFILQRHRQQYQALFIAMIKGEQAKPVSP